MVTTPYKQIVRDLGKYSHAKKTDEATVFL